MGIRNLLRNLKRSYSDRQYALRYRDIVTLQGMVSNNPALASINLHGTHVTISLVNGLTFEWVPTERNSCLRLPFVHDYEQTELNLITELVKTSQTIFDIGANFGYFSIHLKSQFPDLRIYSFEPIISTFQLLKRNFQHNGLVTDTLFNIGFSNASGQTTFYIPEKLGDAWASMGKGVSDLLKYKLKEEIAEVHTLDEFVAKQQINTIDFIKCDVEGAEKLVIEGGAKFLKMNHPTLMLEIGDNWSKYFGYSRQVLIDEMINEYGYLCYGLHNGVLIKIASSKDALKYSEDDLYNYFFVHPAHTAHLLVLEQHLI